jgi:hypothetical protein
MGRSTGRPAAIQRWSADIDGVVVADLFEELGDLARAAARFADDVYSAVARDFGQAAGDLSLGKQEGAGDVRVGVLVGLTDVDDEGVARGDA